jgi:hypothetical protein
MKGKEQGREEGGWGLGTYLIVNRKRWITNGSHIQRAGGRRRSAARQVQGPRGSAVWLGGRGSLLHGRGGGSGGRQHSDWPVGSDAPAGRWAAALWLTGGRVRALHCWRLLDKLNSRFRFLPFITEKIVWAIGLIFYLAQISRLT